MIGAESVNKNFWFEAAAENTSNWNVDPESIEMMEDTLHHYYDTTYSCSKKTNDTWSDYDAARLDAANSL